MHLLYKLRALQYRIRTPSSHRRPRGRARALVSRMNLKNRSRPREIDHVHTVHYKCSRHGTCSDVFATGLLDVAFGILLTDNTLNLMLMDLI